MTAKPVDAAHTAGKQLEAFFLRQVLAETRPHGGMLDGGFAGDTFKQMLDEAIADKVSAAGKFGMADKFAAQLAPKGAAGPTELGPNVPGLPQLAMPVSSATFTSAFGPRIGHTGTVHDHPGVDLAAAPGTPVTAAVAGTVERAEPAGTYGNLVTIRHANGFETRYAHLSAIAVHKGDHVEPGQQVGAVGSTGLSDGPHLHFEIRKDGETIDPAPLLPLKRSGNGSSR